MSPIDITSARLQRAIRLAGAWSAIASCILALCAYASVYHRGLLNTGVLMLLCVMNIGLGGFAYNQPAFPRDTILFGLIPASRPYKMIEPGWSLASVVASLTLTVVVFVTI